MHRFMLTLVACVMDKSMAWNLVCRYEVIGKAYRYREFFGMVTVSENVTSVILCDVPCSHARDVCKNK